MRIYLAYKRGLRFLFWAQEVSELRVMNKLLWKVKVVYSAVLPLSLMVTLWSHILLSPDSDDTASREVWIGGLDLTCCTTRVKE